ncbi:MAG: choice-of-anchor Q domain-containing protein, partial [Acidobacteriota bacterium]
NIALVNNTIFNNASGGIVLGTDNTGFTVDYITVSNNIIVNNGGPAISEQGRPGCIGTHNITTHNLVEGSATQLISLVSGSLAEHTMDVSPQFVNDTGDASGNYHLQPASPAIGAGTSISVPPTDFDGNARPQNGAFDLGAYQYMR